MIADVEVRRQRIRKALDKVTPERLRVLRWREDHALVDKLTHLTEWPSVVMGGFERGVSGAAGGGAGDGDAGSSELLCGGG